MPRTFGKKRTCRQAESLACDLLPGAEAPTPFASIRWLRDWDTGNPAAPRCDDAERGACTTITWARMFLMNTRQVSRETTSLALVWVPWSRVPPLALAGCGPLPRSCRSGCCSCSCATRRGKGRSRSSRAPPLCAGATSWCWPPVRSTARSRQGAARRPATGQMQGYSGSHPNAPRDRCPRRASRRTPWRGRWAPRSPG